MKYFQAGLRIISISLLISQFLVAAPIARAIKSGGTVNVKKLRTQDFNVPVEPGMAIDNGDAIQVAAGAFAVVIFLDDKSVIKMQENTQFQFLDTPNTRTIDIEVGTILNDVKQEGRTKTFRVETPTSVASVKGTIFAAVIDPSGVDQFYGSEGQFDVFNSISGQTVTVGPGQKAISNSAGSLVTAPASPDEYPTDPDPDAGVEEPEPEIEEEEVPEETPQEEPGIETPPEPQPGIEAPEAPPQPEAGAEEPGPSAPSRPYGLGMGIGSVTIDGKVYNQLAFRPELRFGKLGIGLDLVIYLDNDGNIRKEEWNDPSDIMDKFLYIRWAQQGDPFWIQLGALPNVTLGYGGLLMGYSNMVEFPSVRRIGVNGGVQIGNIGTQLFMANVKDYARGGTLLGLRASYRVSKSFPLTIGSNFVMDMNQFSGLKDRDEDYVPDIFDAFPEQTFLLPDRYPSGAYGHNSGDELQGKNYQKDSDGDGIPDEIDYDRDGDGETDNHTITAYNFDQQVDTLANPFNTRDNTAVVYGFAVDLGYPVFSSKFLDLLVYTELNHLVAPSAGDPSSVYYRPTEKSGTGISIPGIRARIMKFLNVGIEYRLKRGYYVPQFFDQSYDIARVVPDYSITGETRIFTKDMSVLIDSTDLSGYFGSASADLFGLATLGASYANMQSEKTKVRSFFASAGLNAKLVPKLSEASAYYQRNNDENPFDFQNPSVNTIFGYRLGYELSPGVSLIWDFRTYYRDDGTGTGSLKPIRQTTIETAFNF